MNTGRRRRSRAPGGATNLRVASPTAAGAATPPRQRRTPASSPTPSPRAQPPRPSSRPASGRRPALLSPIRSTRSARPGSAAPSSRRRRPRTPQHNQRVRQQTAAAAASGGAGGASGSGSGSGAGGGDGEAGKPPRPGVSRQGGAARRASSFELKASDYIDPAEVEGAPGLFKLPKHKAALLQMDQYKVMWKRAQRRLLQAVHAKYPSFVKLFRAFDENKNGVVTFDEFSTRLKTLNDPTHYNPKEARVLFHSVLRPGETKLDFRDMQALFKDHPPYLPGAFYRRDGSVIRPDDDDLPDQDELKTTYKRINEIKSKVVRKIQQQQASSKAYRKDTQYLLQAFRLFDTNGNGLLSYKEVSDALGPKNLNLGLSHQEVLDLCLHVDAQDRGSLSYNNFIDSLAVVDIDPGYDPFKVSRMVHINALKRETGKPYMETQTLLQACSKGTLNRAAFLNSGDTDANTQQQAMQQDGTGMYVATGGGGGGGELSTPLAGDSPNTLARRRRRRNMSQGSAVDEPMMLPPRPQTDGEMRQGPAAWPFNVQPEHRDLETPAGSRRGSATAAAIGIDDLPSGGRQFNPITGVATVRPQTADSGTVTARSFYNTFGAGKGVWADVGGSGALPDEAAFRSTTRLQLSAGIAATQAHPMARSHARAEAAMAAAESDQNPLLAGDPTAVASGGQPRIARGPHPLDVIARSSAARRPSTSHGRLQGRRASSGHQSRHRGSSGGRSRETAGSSAALFATLEAQMGVQQTRFSASPAPRETGGHVGVGGRGPNRRSAFYMDEHDAARFATTTGSTFSTNPAVVQASSFARQQVSKEKRRMLAKTRRLQGHLARMAATIEEEARAVRRAERRRAQAKSRQHLKYLEIMENKEPTVMAAGVTRSGKPNMRNKSSDWFEHNG